MLSAGIMQVGFLDDVRTTGKVVIDADTVRVLGEQDQEFRRADLLSITAGVPKEINFWSGKVTMGMNVRSGNLDQVESNAHVVIKRRTVENRMVFDYIANFNSTDNVEVANNHRASYKWDKFITNRIFWSPVLLEYFRDPFQNIGSRTTLGVGLGYQLIDSPRTDWDVTGGPAYQETRFDDVVAGEPDSETTGALTIGTLLDIEMTDGIDFVYTYRFQLTNEASGSYNHHMVASFETEWTSVLDFDVSLVWDRTQDPRKDSNGIIPEQDDFRLIVGLGIDF